MKENENANARPSRISTRSKPTIALAGTGATASGVTRATAASRAKAAAATGDAKSDHPPIKRKREALGEVTAVNKAKPLAVKGKEKENVKEIFDGVVLKSKTVVTRQPLRTVAGTRQSIQGPGKDKNVKDAKEEPEVINVPDDHAMVIDPAPPVRDPLPSITVRRSIVSKDIATVSTRRSDALRRVSSRLKKQVVDDEDEARQIKRRRTSSEAPEDSHATDEALTRAEDAVEARVAAELEAYAEEQEADPETSPWDDLDADDSDDPLMVSEYVVDIFKYLKQVEVRYSASPNPLMALANILIQLTTMPNPNYMENQKELAWKMRGILTDWLIQVHVRFRLLPETLFLCVNIMDRFLSARVVSLAKLQLVGVTCMFIAAKFEEVVAPSVNHFLVCADSSYTESEILQAERYVLKTLDWNLSYPNPVHYLRRVSKADDYNVKVRTLAKYLLEIGCVEWRLIAAPPSLMAAAAIWLARLALGMELWVSLLHACHSFAHYVSSVAELGSLLKLF